MRVFIVGLAASFAVAAAAVPRAQFRGAVDVVEVTATVTDARGRFLTGLRESDFVVREDGVAQRLIRAGSDREPSRTRPHGVRRGLRTR